MALHPVTLVSRRSLSHPMPKIMDVDESIHDRPQGVHPSNDKLHRKGLVTRYDESSSTVGIQEDDEDNIRLRTTSAAKEVYEGTNHNIMDKSDSFPKFMKRQILVGKILGKGAYSSVLEIRGFQHLNRPTCGPSDVKSEPFMKGPPPISLGSFLQENIKSSTVFLANGTWIPSVNSRISGISLRCHHRPLADDEVLKESREFIAAHCFRNGGDARYAIKCLSKKTMESPQRLLQGIIDMATEARVLSNVTDHPNIVKMRALSESGPFGGSDGFFIVLDRLYDTLEQRLVTWKRKIDRLTGIGAKVLRRDPFGLEKDQLHIDRLVAAYDLSSAVAYLHKNRVIHRDLKPANIGFDIRGDIKIFDFGLAKILPRSGADANECFAFTAMCGTMRYMAPEVGLGKPYNESCDMFSYSILLWEILNLKRPYGPISPEDLQSQVWGPCKKRPPIRSPRGKKRKRKQGLIGTPLQILMKRGWSFNPEERPKMVHVENILRNECISFRNGDDSGLEHNTRRSTHVFHRSKTTRTL